MSDTPLISVVMPAYNVAEYVKKAVDSILGQTCQDFEFLAINDGSTDETGVILHALSKQDKRLRVFDQPNSGVSSALNVGIENARGQYIARMDADDIALPERFATQVAFLSANVDVGVCGTYARLFGDYEGLWESETDWRKIQAWTCFGPVFCHPTVFIKRELLERTGIRYRLDYNGVEDFKMWQDLIEHTRFANVAQPLLLYRTHAKQVTHVVSREKKDVNLKPHYDQLARLQLSPTDIERKIVEGLRHNLAIPEKSYVMAVEQWILKMREANQRLKLFPGSEFDNCLGRDWLMACNKASRLGLWAFLTYRKSLLYQYVDKVESAALEKRFLIKALVKAGPAKQNL